MDLGEKLRSARIEAGLTQKQLCEGLVTRNMLSLIENGSAKPSMGTLAELAKRLGKSVSFFLEETAVLSPNQQVMELARAAYDAQRYKQAMTALKDYRMPDAVYDREMQLLEAICHLGLAEEAISQGRITYARELLEKLDTDGVYCNVQLERERLLLLGRLPGERVSERLPSLDRELLLRGEEAMTVGDVQRAAVLLEACQEKQDPAWLLLRGKIWMAEKKYAQADKCLTGAEKEYPKEAAPLLEICCKELGDYRRAYEYACKQK